MSKHTPERWEWYTSNSYRRLGLQGDYHVIMWGEMQRDGVTSVECESDRVREMIAAAPELLEALRAVLDEVDSDLAYLISDSLRASARALLARIDGESDG